MGALKDQYQIRAYIGEVRSDSPVQFLRDDRVKQPPADPCSSDPEGTLVRPPVTIASNLPTEVLKGTGVRVSEATRGLFTDD